MLSRIFEALAPHSTSPQVRGATALARLTVATVAWFAVLSACVGPTRPTLSEATWTADGPEPAAIRVIAGGNEQQEERSTNLDAIVTGIDQEGLNQDDATQDSAGPDGAGQDETSVTTGQSPTDPEPETQPQPTSTVPLVIFDTDMGPDVDDALALAMLHAYQSEGRIELAAVTISHNNASSVQFTDSLNTFYKRPDIPIGTYRGSTGYQDKGGNFARLSSSWTYDVDPSSVEPGHTLHRRVLARARAEQRRVIVIATGFSGNLSQLIKSGGDSVSPLSGSDLIKSNVQVLSIMAGSNGGTFVEFNVENDISSARDVFASWPGLVVQSPYELGGSIHYPYSSIQSDFGYLERHPIREAYEYADLSWHQDSPPYYNMKSWDLTSVMDAVEPPRTYFNRSQAGKVVVDGSGKTSFQQGTGQHYVLDHRSINSEQQQRIVQRMIELVSAPPSA